MVNSAVTQPEAVSIHTIDHISAMVSYWLKALHGRDQSVQLVSKCWDLADAYKQVPISEESFEYEAFLVVYNPATQRPEIYKQRVLPFGSIASVTSFLRCALGLWTIGTRLLDLVWSAYFDDFLCVTSEALSKHTDLCVSVLFQALGWEISDHKLVPFSTCCRVLGVVLDLGDTKLWQEFVQNTEDRRKELLDELDAVIATKLLKKHPAERLRGRLQFASCQMFGRRMNRCLRALTSHIMSGRSSLSLSESTKEKLEEMRSLIEENHPRVINRHLAEHVHMYVDASFDRTGYSGIGGLLLSGEGELLGCFSEEVPPEVIDLFSNNEDSVVIHELETLAIFVGLEVWRELLTSRRVVVFTDSEATRGSLLRGWSRNDGADLVLEDIFEFEEAQSIALWFERVPSQSNPADELSRSRMAVWHGRKCDTFDLARWHSKFVHKLG